MKKKRSATSKRGTRAHRPPLGQHFLSSEKILSDIIRASRVVPGELILEIGPGKGVLTHALADAGARVIAIERDAHLARALAEEFSANSNVTIIEGDAITLLEEGNIPELHSRPYAVIANIPYAITGRLFRLLWSHPTLPSPTRTVVLVQKEVADRMRADLRDGRMMNLLGLATHCYGVPEYITTVPRGAFQPPPRVLSAVIAVTKHPASPLAEEGITHMDDFFAVARTAFQQKRKKIGTSLKSLWPPQESPAFHAVEKFQHQRPETLSLADWMNLYQGLQKH